MRTGYRLPHSSGVVPDASRPEQRLNVVDLETSIRFYRELFGFELIEKWESPKQAFVGDASTVLGLMEVPTYNFLAYTMAHLAFPCEQSAFTDVVAKVQNMGLEILSGPKPQRGGETILFRDPSGNILEVCYPSIAECKATKT